MASTNVTLNLRAHGFAELSAAAAKVAAAARKVGVTATPKWQKPCPIKFGPSPHQERVSIAARQRAIQATDRAAWLFTRGDYELMGFWLEVRARYLALACRTRSGARRAPR